HPRARRDVQRLRRSVERVLATADLTPAHALGLRVASAREPHQACLAIAELAPPGVAALQTKDLEADVTPFRTLWRHGQHALLRVGSGRAAHQQRAHDTCQRWRCFALTYSARACCVPRSSETSAVATSHHDS